MTSSKQDLSGHTPIALPGDDLDDDPAIGASKGTAISGEDPHILRADGVNTEEGDVGEDADATGVPTPLRREKDHVKKP